MLYRYNFISPEQAEQVRANQQNPEQPVLVIVRDGVPGDDQGVLWRSFGSLMAVTEPYLDGEIVVAWDYSDDGSVGEMVRARFPDREVVEIAANGNSWWFPEE